jgi:hypothetical protein
MLCYLTIVMLGELVLKVGNMVIGKFTMMVGDFTIMVIKNKNKINCPKT